MIIPSGFQVSIAGAPLPRPYFDALRQIEVQTSIENAAVLRLHFEMSRTGIGDWDVTEIDIFRPLVPLTIRVTLGTIVPETLINGYIRDATQNTSSRPGQSTLDVVAMDATATLMNRIETTLPQPNMPDFVIAQTIFGRNGIIPLCLPTPSTRVITQTTTMQRATDIQFLKMMARRNSYECFVQPDPILGLDTGYFGPAKTTAPHQAVLSVDFGRATNVDNFNVSNDMTRPTTAMAVMIDPQTGIPLPAIVPVGTEPPMGVEPALLRAPVPGIVRPAGTDATNTGELLSVAQSIVNRSSRALRASGTADGLRLGSVLRPGLPVLVRGAGREHSGMYYLTQVTHTITTQGYRQSFSGWRNAVGLTGAEVFFDPRAALQ